MTSFLTLPVMFWLGTAAIASPIIIHLLNRRRFKIVDWAAMDFLLNANRKNRRRIQLENIILLILRCIAIFLVGLLLSRPFFPNDINLFGENQQFERIVVLDDSFSMNVRTGNKTVFENAKEKLKGFVKNLSEDKATNYLTLMLTSDIENPIIPSLPVTPDTMTEIDDVINEIRCSDFPASYDEGLRSIVEETAGKKEGLNRIFYLLTDLRQQDWWFESQSAEGNPAQNLLKDVGANTPLGCYLVDVGGDSSVNLGITSLQPESPLKSGVNNSFYVTVTNFGGETVKDVRLDFYSTESAVAQSEFIEAIEPGMSKSVTRSFPVTFELSKQDELDDDESFANVAEYWKVWATLNVEDVSRDSVEVDSTRYFAARVKRGTSVLLVDGDPSAIEDRSETYYLRRALRPVDSNSGVIPTVIGLSELSSVDFSKYQVVYLCNVDELSQGQLETLEKWVAEGGSLVLMVGDQINEAIFNRQFYFDPEKSKRVAESKSATEVQKMVGGGGLSPLKLTGMDGDVNQESWVNLDLGEESSRITAVFEGQGNIAASLVNFYSWWNSEQSGLEPIPNPVSPTLTTGKHYKFGASHASSKEYQETEAGMPTSAKERVFEVSSRAVEVGSEFVISDVLGAFEKCPIRLVTDSEAKFSYDGKLESELILNRIPKAKSKEAHQFGCWRVRYSNGDVWTVKSELPENVEDLGENTSVLAVYNDEGSHPAIAEKRFGEGRVVLCTFPADEDWTNLPQIGSANLLLHIEMCDYLGDGEQVEPPFVGEGIREVIDISRLKPSASITPPRGEKRNLTAIPFDAADPTKGKYWQLSVPKMEEAGFYDMVLVEQEKQDGKDVADSRVFSANVMPAEGDLKRLDLGEVGTDYFGDQIKLIDGTAMSAQTVQGARTEYWMYVLFLLGGILIVEQFLGWVFGRRR
ncbi:MAG: BatA domain-containing protein [Pirellulaceae bacterium]|nr:BatA domain-containing protein [Pirellulaceae bacterium]